MMMIGISLISLNQSLLSGNLGPRLDASSCPQGTGKPLLASTVP